MTPERPECPAGPPPRSLASLRDAIAQINDELLRLLSDRAALALEVRALKEAAGDPMFAPEREEAMLRRLVERNPGPYSDAALANLFRHIFRASLGLMEQASGDTRRVSRQADRADRVILVRGVPVGAAPIVIAGPCAIESAAQMEAVAQTLVRLGVRFLRGGAFKPRTSPYAFQGLGVEGLRLLADVTARYDLRSVTEVTDPRSVALVVAHADVLQVGARNMFNYDLLAEVGRAGKPVLLKRGPAATVDELLWAAEYIANEGNEDIVLCERGVRGFERATRNTLDIAAVPLLRQQTFLPVIVDPSHAAGRADLVVPLAQAALAAGAHGVMVEVHPDPPAARSDAAQQLSFAAFESFLRAIGWPIPTP